jgi:hypothetical protein
MPGRRPDLLCTNDALGEDFGHKRESDVRLYRTTEDFDNNYAPNSDTRIPDDLLMPLPKRSQKFNQCRFRHMIQ